MKTRLKLNWLTVMAITLTGLLPTAHAFYAPATQRWLNRDPLGDEGAIVHAVERQALRMGQVSQPAQNFAATETEVINLYRFAGNSPLGHVDPFGLLFGFRYGNWCGWSNAGQNGPPIDELDFACMVHDNCLATWQDACKSFTMCNQIFAAMASGADCSKSPNPKACKSAQWKILVVFGGILAPRPF